MSSQNTPHRAEGEPANLPAGQKVERLSFSRLSWADRFAGLDQYSSVAALDRDLESALKDLDQVRSDFQKARARGFIYHLQWEQELEQIRLEQADICARLFALVSDLQVTVENLTKTNTGDEAELQTLRDQFDDARRRLKFATMDLSDKIKGIQSRVGSILWKLDLLDQASFALVTGESLVDAYLAKWQTASGEIEGILYITDFRLFFEQCSVETVRKILFLPSEVKKTQKLEWVVPFEQLEKVVWTQQGVLGWFEVITLHFLAGAPLSSAKLQFIDDAFDVIKGEVVAGIIGRVKSGEIARERIEAPQFNAARIPTNCPECGGPIQQSILRGQVEVPCAYCGIKIHF